MKRLRIILLTLALLSPAAPALTQQEMLLRYEGAKLSVADMRRQCYQQGMFLLADYIPRAGEGTLALALTPEGCRLVGGIPEGNPIRPDDDYRVHVYILSEDGRRMGYMRVEVKGNGRVVRVLRSSQPGEFCREGPHIFEDKNSGTRVSWHFEQGAFHSLRFDYGREYLSGKVYGADGKVSSISLVPSLKRCPVVVSSSWLRSAVEEGLRSAAEGLPTMEPDELEPPPPVLDASGVEGRLALPPEGDSAL